MQKILKTVGLGVGVSAVSQVADVLELVQKRNAENPHATYTAKALETAPNNVGGCYSKPPRAKLEAAAMASPLSFTAEELLRAGAGPSIDWRKEGAVNPVQQQHPFGTCWYMTLD